MCCVLHLFVVSVMFSRAGSECRAKTVAKEKSSAITTRDGVVVVSFFLPVLISKVTNSYTVVWWQGDLLRGLVV